MGCKQCNSEHLVKNGFVRDQQRWLCKDCGLTFVAGDKRASWRQQDPKRKALAILLCSVGVSFRLAARIVQSTHVSVQRWFEEKAKSVSLPPPDPEEVKVISLDEMWHFIQKKQKNSGSGKPPMWTVKTRLDSSTWLLVSVIPEPVNDC
jgi:transposase-like protein